MWGKFVRHCENTGATQTPPHPPPPSPTPAPNNIPENIISVHILTRRVLFFFFFFFLKKYFYFYFEWEVGSLLLLLYLLGLLLFFFVFNVSGPRILKPQNCKGGEYKQYARIHSQHTGHQSVHNESGCSKLPSKSKPVQKVSFATLSHKNSSRRCHTNIIHKVITQILFTTLSHKYYSQRYHVPRLDA